MKLQAVRFVIVGGGAAGFAAALEAAQAGAEVLLLEKMAQVGGSSAMSAGCLAFAGTDLQKSQGVEDGADLLRRDLLEVGRHQNDPALVDAYVRHQLDTYVWLRALGVEFSDALDASAGQSVPRVHTLDPADLLRVLVDRCQGTGRVRVLTSTRAVRLLRPHEGAAVTGLLAEGPDGPLEIHASGGVLLASGGFVRNAAMVKQFAPQCAEAVFVGGEGNVGEGLRMAWKLGADLRDMASIKGTFGKHPTDTVNPYNCMAVYKGAIAVNQAGKRFADESISYKLLGDAVLAQPHHRAYQVFDQPIFDSGDDRVRILDFHRRMAQGLVIRAATLEALARRIEVPWEALRATIERYNQCVDAGHDPEFGRRALVHRHGALRRIEQGPFYAYPSTAVVFGTYCGLRVDAGMRVIDVFDQPIEGLYAAGEVVGGLHGGAYMTGAALGQALVFGRLAARSALQPLVSAA
jgi:fumarate reductase flavoprotein subunit